MYLQLTEYVTAFAAFSLSLLAIKTQESALLNDHQSSFPHTFNASRGSGKMESSVTNLTTEFFNITTSFELDEVVKELNKDHFEGVFSNTTVNLLTLITYPIGLVCCFALLMVSWFEKSGQAGPYRTLANQLISSNLDQVSVNTNS